jgi:DNA recombination protein RmuC
VDEEKLQWIANAQQNLRETFEVLASKSLRENARDFDARVGRSLDSHAQRIDVLKSALEKNVGQNLTSHSQQIEVLKSALEKDISQLDVDIRELERKREGAYHSLKQQVLQLDKTNSFLLQTTQQLLAALKSGPIRGRWGEIQLRKIVELSGMSEHVSFAEQVVGSGGGKPDTIVHLPNEGRIPIDSKFPLQAFLEAIEAVDDEIRKAKVVEHVKVLREKIRDLSKKTYWREFDPSPELTIMFIPIESCLSAAYEHDPEIIEFALEQKIILASPVTLLGFMKSIAYGWQQFTINKNARKILVQGKELYDRMNIWLDHYRKTGDRISALSKCYNDSVASLQSRFLPACRRFQELTAIVDEIPDIDPIVVAVNIPISAANPDEETPALAPSASALPKPPADARLT